MESRVFLLRAFALGQIENERNALVATFLEQRAADQHWHAPAIFPEILLLERLKNPGRAQFREGAFVPTAPFGRRQIGPAQATRSDVFVVVLQHAEKRIIGLENLAVEIPQTNSDDIRVHQAPNPRITGDIATKPSREPP